MKIQSKKQVYYFDSRKVVRFEKQGDRTLAFQSRSSSPVVIDENINVVLEQLEDSQFIKVHPEHIINVNCISKIPRNSDNSIEMEGGDLVPILELTKEKIIYTLQGHFNL